MTGGELIKVCKKAGWFVERVKGSHHIMRKAGVTNELSVPVHGAKDLPKGILNAILKKAGIKL